MPANIRDCVPGVAGAKLTGKINVDLLLFFLNCLRAVLAVAEAINYPCECPPPNLGCQWRARLWHELPLSPQMLGRNRLPGLSNSGIFSLCLAPSSSWRGVLRLVLLDRSRSAQHWWEHRSSPCSSASPASIEGCRRPCPHTFKGYYSYFYHRFLKSHFSGCSVCAEKHHSPGRNLP